jgi:type IV secretory pathway TraG/TraD family ATPase VirD4
VTATSRRSSGSRIDPGTVVLWIVLVLVVVGVGAVTAAVHLGRRLAGSAAAGTEPLPGNPFELVIGLGTGTVAWPAPATWVLAGLGAAGLLLAGLATAVTVRLRRRRSRVDRAARHMGRGTGKNSPLHALSHRGAAASAARLGVTGPVGLPIAQTVAGGQALYSSWEDVSVDIWGPRTGKTTSRAIPAILDAPGAVLATSNKRDLVDATRGPRAGRGPLWVFDPQGIVDEPADWWWNPLTYVTNEVKAAMLAEVFTSAARDPGARTDAFFDPAAQELLAGLLLAAALDDRPVTQVYLWLTDPTDDEPALILRRHDYPLSAAAVGGVVNAPDKQRGGVYGTAQQIGSFLTNRQAVRWVTPTGVADGRRQFDPAAFVRSSGTLYSLSKEGRGSAGPLVTALTVAVTEAAEELAKRSAGGRLPVPMVAVLDEAANVCRWRELPNQYSHYGSRGIVVLTILQSWSQGVEVWGREGMRKLWSAANVKVYGGGVSEVEFLSELSQLIGDYDLHATSTSHGKGGRSTSHSTRRERVLDVADLAALPRGRAVVLSSGAPATLARTLPWMTGPHATAVEASIRAHDPASEATITEATRSVAAMQADEAYPAGAGR